MAMVMSTPMIGSASGKPAQAPAALMTTARLVNPSVRACRPSATSAADPILRPVRIRYCATISLPMKPTIPAATRTPRWCMSPGLLNRRIASYPASAADSAISTTTTIPARSSARPKP